MDFLRRGAALAAILVLLAAPAAVAQVQTGSITGVVTDTSSAVLPGVNVTLSGEKLIGGAATGTFHLGIPALNKKSARHYRAVSP